ncbi:putative F-box protein PP2-B12 [Populus trichocarpa]|uniref:putative F-box protein PP2-B12 n=1 Tax=Populus trichocarpa TaxID=3694 RepID=UPI000D187A9C|nr:putative F-box protein PP2-B12 [Populus trichocarpa]|eukprot:XP_024445662.1 putative F-box protein PP2-B12 [Populus trichocarpa]
MASENEEAGELSLNLLPEGCIANVLSFTSPLAACRLSIVSPLFRSAAETGAFWERFLPRDLLSESDSPLLVSSKKQLYLSLCGNPILIEDGKKSFSLEKKSGKKLYTLSARDLGIAWGDAPEYWGWTSDPGSRFSEVAHLLCVCWLEISSKINTSMPAITSNIVHSTPCLQALRRSAW